MDSHTGKRRGPWKYVYRFWLNGPERRLEPATTSRSPGMISRETIHRYEGLDNGACETRTSERVKTAHPIALPRMYFGYLKEISCTNVWPVIKNIARVFCFGTKRPRRVPLRGDGRNPVVSVFFKLRGADSLRFVFRMNLATLRN